MTPKQFQDFLLQGEPLAGDDRTAACLTTMLAITRLADACHDPALRLAKSAKVVRDLSALLGVLVATTADVPDEWDTAACPESIADAFFGLSAGRKGATLQVFAWLGWSQQEIAELTVAKILAGEKLGAGE